MEEDRGRSRAGALVNRCKEHSCCAEAVVEIEPVRPGIQALHPRARQEPFPLDRDGAVADRLAENTALFGGPRIAFRRIQRDRVPLDSRGKLPGDPENCEVVLRQAHLQLGCRSQFGTDWNLLLDAAQAESVGEEAIRLKSILDLVVVVGRIEVLMKREVGGGPVQGPHRLERVIRSRLDPVRPEDILRVVDLQEGPGRDQGCQVRVFEFGEHIGTLLLPIPDVSCPEVLEPGDQRGVARHRHGRPHSLVQGAQEHGLPAASRKAGHADPLLVDSGMPMQVVQALLRREIEQADPVGANQIQVRPEPMLVLRMREFAEIQPVEIESVDTLLGLVDAALLLVLDLLALAVNVTVDVQNRRRGARGAFRLVQEGRNVKTGKHLDS